MTIPEVDGRTARRAVSTRKIVRAAAELFAEQGYGSTTMDEVAEAAGVSKGTIFNNVSSKADLGALVIQTGADELAATMEDARTGLVGWDALTAITLSVMQRIDAEPSLAQVLVTELFRPSRPWSAQLPAARARLLAPLAAVLGEVADQRRTAGVTIAAEHPGNIESVAISLFGALVNATLDRLAYPGPSLDTVHNGLVAAISGLRPNGTEGSLAIRHAEPAGAHDL